MGIAEGMAEIKDQAYVAATVTTERNQKEKQKEAEKLEKKINKFRQNEGKDMYDGHRALKEAIMQQQELPSKKAKKMAKKKKKKIITQNWILCKLQFRRVESSRDRIKIK